MFGISDISRSEIFLSAPRASQRAYQFQLAKICCSINNTLLSFRFLVIWVWDQLPLISLVHPFFQLLSGGWVISIYALLPLLCIKCLLAEIVPWERFARSCYSFLHTLLLGCCYSFTMFSHLGTMTKLINKILLCFKNLCLKKFLSKSLSHYFIWLAVWKTSYLQRYYMLAGLKVIRSRRSRR